MKTGLFCGTFRVFQNEKKPKKRRKSNKETPKEIREDPLTTLRPSLEYSLEFPYCFLTRISAFSVKSWPDLSRASDSGGPSLPLCQNGPEFKKEKPEDPRASRGSFFKEKPKSDLFVIGLLKKSTLNAVQDSTN